MMNFVSIRTYLKSAGIFLIGCMFCAISSNGQSFNGQNMTNRNIATDDDTLASAHNISGSHRDNRVKGWYISGEINLGSSNATNSDHTYSTSGNLYIGANILATKMFNQHIGIQFGLGDVASEYNVKNSAASYYPLTSDVFTQGILTIPVRVLFFSNSKKRAGLYINAGLDISVVWLATDQENDNLTSYYSPVNVIPSIACGVEFRNRRATRVWMFGPFYKTTLSNFYSGNSDTWMNSGNTGKLNSFGLSMAYLRR